MNIEITTPEPSHATTSRRVGDWITFTCEQCGYVRTMNAATGDMQVVKQGEAGVLHSGMSYPEGIDPEYSMN